MMGIQVEVPAQRRKTSTVGLLETSRDSKGSDHEAWQWGPFESLSIHGASSLTDTPADTLADSPDSSKHLISPSITASSSPLSCSTTSPSSSGGCVDPYSGKTASHQRLKKGRDSSLFACNGELRPSRWDSDRWSANSSFEERSMRPRGKRVCKVAAGVTADVAAVCCCPFSLLHLLAVAFVKVPATLVSKTLVRVKRKIVKKRRRAAVHEEDDENYHEEDSESFAASSCPPSRCRSYEAGDVQTWAPALAFGDQKLWRDYFDSPDTAAVWSSEELLKAKSDIDSINDSHVT